MDISYRWHFGAFECAPTQGSLNNVIETIHWRLFGTFEDYTAEAYGTVTLDAVQEQSFTDYQELTQETIIEWVTSKLDMDAVHAGIEQQLEDMINPKSVVLTAPWS